MNIFETHILTKQEIPFPLTQIPQPPKKLYLQGNLPKENVKILCVVGSRKYSNYGEEVVKKLILGLKGHPICIVSGLAVGIDGLAHKAALEAGLQTIAFPGSGLDPKVLYPQSHNRLAEEILYAGGGLISEYEMLQPARPWTFPERNRLMAGISHAALIIEGKDGSGSSITARLALEYDRIVATVPQNISSPLSELPNRLIRAGAVPITSSEDILEMLGINTEEPSSFGFDRTH